MCICFDSRGAVCSDDEEAQLGFTSSKGPPGDAATPVHRVVKEVKRNWWLWGAVCFALVLITGVVMFRHKLYNTGNFGLPFLAGIGCRPDTTSPCLAAILPALSFSELSNVLLVHIV